MPEFISKVQHKTYEKGEFSDEKARSLADTVELIKNFPWAEERPLTSVELTGPSITIKDEDLNYLKVGLYFNGKYCLYYLDRDNHLYEYYAPDLADACNKVTDYFNGQLDLSKFDKHFFNIGNQGHFVNKDFTYTVSTILTGFYFLLFGSITVGMLAVTVIMFRSKIMLPFQLIYIFLDTLYFYIIYITIMIDLKARKLSLIISRGNDRFWFGKAGDLMEYHKDEVSEIAMQPNGRSSRIFNIMNISFKNGASITVPGAVIDPDKLAAKFPNKKVEIVMGFMKRIKAQWNFIHQS